MDGRDTVSGCNRGEQRHIYDERRHGGSKSRSWAYVRPGEVGQARPFQRRVRPGRPLINHERAADGFDDFQLRPGGDASAMKPLSDGARPKSNGQRREFDLGPRQLQHSILPVHCLA